jgi:hypothetical protein
MTTAGNSHEQYLPRTRAKELSLRQLESRASSTFATHARHIVTPPIKANVTRVLHTEEDDNGRNTDGSRPRSAEHVVVLGPTSQVASLEPDHGNETNRDLRPDVSHVVGSPGESAVDDGDGVDLTKPLLLGEGASDVVEDWRHNKTYREANEEKSVQSTLAEDLVRTQSTPKHGSSEESVVSRAVEAVRCAGSTHVLDVDLEVEHTGADDGRDETCHHLGPESVAGRNLGVMCELEIVQELNSVSTSDVAERLEEVHGQSVTSDPGSADKLG